MLFDFNARSALLLPFVGPGLALSLFLLVRSRRTGALPDLLLALLVAWPTLAVAQWMLGFAGWYDLHDAYSTFMFYVPWQVQLAQGPLWYLYFRALTNQEFRLRPRAWLHLLPGLLEIGLWAATALLDVGLTRGLRDQPLPDHFGTKGAAATWLDGLYPWLAGAGHALLLAYGAATSRAYRRYETYLADNFSAPERLRFRGLRQVLGLLLAGLVLSLSYSLLEAGWGPFSYNTDWWAFVVRGGLIYALAVVGLQANYAAATAPLRFEADNLAETAPAVAGALLPSGSALPAVSGEPEPEGLAAPATAGTFQPSGLSVPAMAGAFLPSGLNVPVMAGALLPSGSALPATAGTVQPLGLALPATAGGLQPQPAPVPAAAPLPPELLPLRDKLLVLMKTEQPWLEPELTLTELAHRLRLAPAVLSKVINAGLGMNFSDFVNGYRVAEARQKLADPRFAHYSLVGVALESGFNSKSTFNRVFKKVTGHAPGEVARPKS